MLIYLTIFIAAVLIYLFSPQNRRLVYMKYVMAFLALFVGISDMLGGYDRYIYGELFDELALIRRKGGVISDAAIFNEYYSEWAYIALNYIISFLTSNRYIFILLVTCLIYTLLYRAFRDYTSDYLLAIVLFLGLWFFFSFTYLRQVLAAVVGWMSIRYALSRKPWRFLAIVLIAYGFHNSAILLLPIYFLPARKLKLTNVVMLLFFCAIIGSTNIAGNLFETYISVSGQEERLAQVSGRSEGIWGIRSEYILETFVFLWFIFRNYDKYDNSDRRAMFMRNMALVFCMILLVFVRSENGGRLSWFYMIGVIAAMTDIVSYTRKKEIAWQLIVISAMLFIRILISWNTLIMPYKSFFTSGHRDEDYVYQKFEYDYAYDDDKFYKL